MHKAIIAAIGHGDDRRDDRLVYSLQVQATSRRECCCDRCHDVAAIIAATDRHDDRLVYSVHYPTKVQLQIVN